MVNIATPSPNGQHAIFKAQMHVVCLILTNFSCLLWDVLKGSKNKPKINPGPGGIKEGEGEAGQRLVWSEDMVEELLDLRLVAYQHKFSKSLSIAQKSVLWAEMTFKFNMKFSPQAEGGI